MGARWAGQEGDPSSQKRSSGWRPSTVWASDFKARRRRAFEEEAEIRDLTQRAQRKAECTETSAVALRAGSLWSVGGEFRLSTEIGCENSKAFEAGPSRLRDNSALAWRSAALRDEDVRLRGKTPTRAGWFVAALRAGSDGGAGGWGKAVAEPPHSEMGWATFGPRTLSGTAECGQRA